MSETLFRYFCILIVDSRFDYPFNYLLNTVLFVSFLEKSFTTSNIIVYTRPLVHKTVLYVDNVTIIINYIKLMAIKINSLQII